MPGFARQMLKSYFEAITSSFHLRSVPAEAIPGEESCSHSNQGDSHKNRPYQWKYGLSSKKHFAILTFFGILKGLKSFQAFNYGQYFFEILNWKSSNERNSDIK